MEVWFSILVAGMDLSGTRSCRVPESCPWESLRDTNSKKIVSLDLRDTIKGHDTIFVSLIVSLSCPLIVSLRDTNRVQIFGSFGHDSCP